jgi:hypothetical protein
MTIGGADLDLGKSCLVILKTFASYWSETGLGRFLNNVDYLDGWEMLSNVNRIKEFDHKLKATIGALDWFEEMWWSFVGVEKLIIANEWCQLQIWVREGLNG